MLQAIISGIMLGGVYGLFSMGFSLAFGVMRIVNFAHGEMVMLGMYLTLFAFTQWHIDPLAMVIVAPLVLGMLGVVVYLVVFQRYVGRATLQQLLSGIALALILQALAQLAFSPDTRAINDPWGAQYLVLGSVFLSYAQIVAFSIAVLSIVAVEWALHYTRWGQAVRAVADDREAAELIGQNAHWINLSAFALSTAMAGAAGAVLVTYLPVSPAVGFSLMPIAFIATVLGGLGSVSGAFLGGIICGVVEQITSVFWNPSLQDIPLYLLLLIFLAWRQYGLFGRKAAH